MIQVRSFARLAAFFLLCFPSLASAAFTRTAADSRFEAVDRLEREAMLLRSRCRYAEALRRYLDALRALANMPAPDDAARRVIGARGETCLSEADGLIRVLDAWRAGDEALGEIVSRPIDPMWRARAIVSRWTYRRSRSDVPKPPLTPEGLGSLTDWLLIGPFENEQGGGFDREFPPETEIKLDATYDGKDRKVSWRRAPVPGKASVDLGALFTPNEQCLAYALTAVSCERPTPVALRLATSDGVKVFVNGSPVLSRDVRRARRFDQDSVGFTLPAGWSSILLKVTQRTGDWSFSARLTDADGEPLELTATVDPSRLEPSALSTEKPEPIEVRRGSLAVLEEAVAAHPKDAWARYRLALLLDFVRPLDAADMTPLAHLTEATRLEPSNPYFLFQRARASIRPAEMTPEREENAYRRDLEAVLDLDPEYAEAANALARYYLETLVIPSRAEALFDRALRANPENLDACILKRHVLGQRNLEAQANVLLLGMSRNPRLARRTEFLDAWVSFLWDRKRIEEARQALMGALVVDRRNGRALDSLVQLYSDAGQIDEAIAVLNERIANDPYDSDALVDQADLLDSHGRAEEAIAACARAVQLNPQDDKRRQELAVLLHRAGRDADALAELDEAKRLNPKDPWTERYLQFLRGEKRPFDAEIRTNPTDVALQAKTVTAERNEPYAYMLRETTVKANADGTATRYEHFVAKILNPRGAVRLDRYPVPYAVGEQEVEVLVNRAIRPDGTTIQGRIASAQGSRRGEYQVWDSLWIDSPTLEVGDVLEIAFRVKDVEQSFFGDYFGYSHDFYAPDLAPVRNSRFTLIRPRSRQVYLNVKNGAPEPAETPGDEEGAVAYRFEMKDLPGIDPEPYMPPPSEFLPRVEATTYGTWDDFANWWWNLIRNEFSASEPMKAKVRALTEGLDDVTAKARALYDFVVSDIRYEAWEFGVHGYKPYHTATVFDRGFGDCKDKAILLCTLLKEIGVQAAPVLIHAGMLRPREDLSLPLVSHFNHCIAVAQLPTGRLYVDGTAQFHSMGTIPDMDRGAKVLEVVDGRAELAEVPEAGPDENVLDEGFEVTVSPDGAAIIRGAVQATGTAGVEVRARFGNVGRREDAIAARFNDLFGKTRVTSSRFSDLRNLEEVPHYSFELSVPDFLKRSGADWTAPVTFFSRSLRSFAALETRRFDILLPPVEFVRFKLRYRLPSNLEPLAMPEPKSLDPPFGRYRRTVEVEGADLVIECEMCLSVRRVSAADYPAFREFCLEISEAEEAILRLRDSATPSQPR